MGTHQSLYFANLICIGLLVFQNAGQAILIRTVSIRPESERYIPGVVVFLTETLKCLFSVGGLLFVHGRDSLRMVRNRRIKDTLVVAVPAVVYVVQNQLSLVALQNLDSATFQILSQLKILFTAFFSWIFRLRNLTIVQCCSLVVLTVCAVLLTAPDCEGKEHKSDVPFLMAGSRLIGLTCLFLLTMLSGFGAAFTEKQIKHAHNSFFLFNIELSAHGIWASLLTVYLRDSDTVQSAGLFRGFDSSALMVVLSMASGGMLVAAVVKLSSSITKLFAVTVSIILTVLYSALVYSANLSIVFWCSLVLVVVSIFLYHFGAPVKHVT